MATIFSTRKTTLLLQFVLSLALLLFCTLPGFAQQHQTVDGLQPLHSDVGINGLTANIHQLASFKDLSNDTLHYDGSSELEFVFRDVRMLSPRLGAGFNVLLGFFTNDAKGQPSFGIASWGIGPTVRLYPFKTNRLQPYLQANALFGNNMAVGKLADTRNRQGGFRVRLGLRGGLSFRITNGFGIFAEYGPDWESSALFKADARTLQFNFGIDVFRFK